METVEANSRLHRPQILLGRSGGKSNRREAKCQSVHFSGDVICLARDTNFFWLASGPRRVEWFRSLNHAITFCPVKRHSRPSALNTVCGWSVSEASVCLATARSAAFVTSWAGSKQLTWIVERLSDPRFWFERHPRTCTSAALCVHQIPAQLCHAEACIRDMALWKGGDP